MVLGAALRTVATVGVVLAVYFVAPMDSSIDAAAIAKLVLAAVALGAVIGFQECQINGVTGLA